MYVPPFNAVDDEAQLREMVRRWRTGWLVSSGEGGLPVATFLPVIWRGGTVFAHMARANSHWRSLNPDVPVLLICTGPDAYVSPNWYAAKAEHGRVVPTWNYSAVHLTGSVELHEDEQWLRSVVTELTELHESDRPMPWHVTDAPAAYITGQLGGIVGLELTVRSVEGKAKLSQNRSEADRVGVVDGLRGEPYLGAEAVMEAMTDGLVQ